MAGRINVHAHGNSGIRPEITADPGRHAQRRASRRSSARRARSAPAATSPPWPSSPCRSWARASRSTRASAWPPGSPSSAPASPIPGLQARDGLGTINGANVLTAMSALLLYDADALAAPGRDRLRHEPRGAAGQPQALRHPPARAARLRRRGAQRGRHQALHRGLRPGDRQDQDQGAGRLLHALLAAGDRRRPRRRRLGPHARSRSS